ncbi:pyrroline-5-carboxylate reductase [Pseudopedobacter saltans DSM 12145]|uniref:Pyrroline-5-carboxylate reductase n=1 Tax=Pseudopedobacter saltans (strain ATCC 51119 / DSM 12145 / JCM 21818 / CCUG 39354 / LMG 10337 / NBRC 100064 / NCIMB 13643) TaxID=762903 RepID=F0SBA3_PSESL|nr:pyrroline-5-carboxylate reductase [Pseudopedobacter saltans]ADY53730.1 pyrroline-5-carboxylate reductase [Pseudopedobacter saltans DSM 12145]
MSNKSSIAILGTGNMGAYIALGLSKSGMCDPASITLTRRNLDALAEYKSQGFNISNDNVAAAKEANIIILGVLPQQLNEVLDQIAPVVDESKHLIVSIISGVSSVDIQKKLNKNIEVIRVMPNTAIAINQSMTCIAGDHASKENIELVKNIFSTVGVAMVIKEDLMPAATALCSSGIAFFLRTIRAATEAGVQMGFHSHEALEMASQTVKGAADLLIQLGGHPEVQIDRVTSPKGCTIAGLNEMEHNGFSSALIKGITLAGQKAGNLLSQDK